MFEVTEPRVGLDTNDIARVTLDILDNADFYINAHVAQDMVGYAQGNIEAGKYPASFASSGRDTPYPPLATKTVRDKVAMGAPHTKRSKRFGTMIDSIHVDSVQNGTIVIIADATHGAEMRRAKSRLAHRVGGTTYDLKGLSPFTPGSGERQIARGHVPKFGPKRRFTRADVGRERSRMGKAISHSKWSAKGRHGMRGSYAYWVNDKWPFLKWTKDYITGQCQHYLNEALAHFGHGTQSYDKAIEIEVG